MRFTSGDFGSIELGDKAYQSKIGGKVKRFVRKRRRESMDLETHFDEAFFVVKTVSIGHGLKQVDFACVEHQLCLPYSFVFFQAAQFEARDDIRETVFAALVVMHEQERIYQTRRQERIY